MASFCPFPRGFATRANVQLFGLLARTDVLPVTPRNLPGRRPWTRLSFRHRGVTFVSQPTCASGSRALGGDRRLIHGWRQRRAPPALPDPISNDEGAVTLPSAHLRHLNVRCLKHAASADLSRAHCRTSCHYRGEERGLHLRLENFHPTLEQTAMLNSFPSVFPGLPNRHLVAGIFVRSISTCRRRYFKMRKFHKKKYKKKLMRLKKIPFVEMHKEKRTWKTYKETRLYRKQLRRGLPKKGARKLTLHRER